MKVDLLREKILPSLIKLAMPLMATAFVQVTYNIVDMIWLGRLGTQAVAASGSVGTYIWLMNAFMIIPRIGVSIRGSQAYGAGSYDKAVRVYQNGIQFAVFLSLIATSLCLVFRYQLIGFYKLDPTTEKLAIQYFSIVAFGFIFSYLNPILSASYNSQGNSLVPFKYNTLGLISNIVLDPLLIFGLGPLRAFGISGAALATVLAQALVSLLFLMDIIKEKGFLYQCKLKSKPCKKEFLSILKLGYPGAMRSSVQAMVAIILNKFMALYGATPIAAYSIGTQIESISYMTSDGFASAMTAFTGQNYGAKQFSRIREMAKKALTLMFTGGCLVMLAFILFGESIFTLFLPDDPEAISLGAYYLIILGISQPLMNIEIGTTGVFNGIGRPKFPGMNGVILNIMRIPLAFILMKPFGVIGIWVAITISSMLKGLINYIVLRKQLENLDEQA